VKRVFWASNRVRLSRLIKSIADLYPVQLIAVLLILFGVTACDTWPRSHLKIPPVSTKAYQMYKINVDRDKNVLEQKCVFVDGQDIQMPLTSGKFDPQENRTYSFDIWAYDTEAPPKTTLEELRRDGTFSLEVVGVKASINMPDYLPAAGPPQQLLKGVTNGLSADDIAAMNSRNRLVVRIRSQDITGPFTIIAWFPSKYRKWQAQQSRPPLNSLSTRNEFDQNSENTKNPFGEKRTIKVYNGDLRTRIDIVDQREAEASFGKVFAEHFYVGRVYLRNRHPDKRMVVYSTSMRANILLYRPPVPEFHETNLPQTSRTPPPSPSWLTQFAQEPLTKDQTNALRIDVTNRRATERRIRELEQAVDAAFFYFGAQKFPETGRYSERIAATAATFVEKYVTKPPVGNGKDATNAENKQDYKFRLSQAATEVALVWSRLGQQIKALTEAADTSDAEAASQVVDELSSVPTGSDDDKVLRLSVAPHLFQLIGREYKAEINGNDYRFNSSAVLPDSLGKYDVELNGHYSAATNAIVTSGLSSAEQARLQSLAQQIYARRLHAGQRRMLSRALRFSAPQTLDDPDMVSVSVRQEYDSIISRIRREAMGDSGNPSPNPFARVKDIVVNTDPRALAFSESSDRQIELSKVGYLWRETYRPMTFQAVLNSLMFTHENSYSTRTFKLLQSAATIAGGMVGLGTVVNEFSSQGYLQGVNLFSTIFVPEIGKLILEDLNKHIRNLGEMGMDTVVIVPPNDIVDHYIFFPKGPIYNFVDEFNVKDPAYIKSVDNDDVGVEATLIDQGVNVQGGGLDSAALSSRALNEGQLDANAELLKQTEMQDRLRRLTLTVIASKIETLLSGTTPAGTNGVKSQKRIQAEKQVCSLAKTYQAQFGTDSTGILTSLLSQYGVDCDNSPPTVLISAIPSVDLIGGITSGQFVLPVSDIMGIWNLKITNSSSNPDFISSTNVFVRLPLMNESGPAHFSVLAATSAAQTEDVNVFITFSISNSLALSAHLPVPVTIHPPQLTFQPLTSGFTLTGNSLVLGSTERVEFCDVLLPVYDSDLSGDMKTNWSLSLPNSSTNGWHINVDPSDPRQTQFKGTRAIAWNLAIDPSTATNQKPLALAITVSRGGKTIASTNLQVVIKPDPH
jgi:hypothetical protein